jgi:hypothetical protein
VVSKASYVDESLFGKPKFFPPLFFSPHDHLLKSLPDLLSPPVLSWALKITPITTIILTVLCYFFTGNTKKKGDTNGLTKEALRDIREKTEKGLKSEAIVIKQDELDRMKGASKITSKEAEI